MQAYSKEYFNLSVLFIGFLSFCSTGKQLVKYVKKFLKKLKFFQKFKQISNTSETFISENYILFRGKAIKIFTRGSGEIDPSIILSESNTTYYEDFMLLTENKQEKFYLQPDNKTRLHYLPYQYLRCEKFLHFFYKLFFRKSQVLKNDDNIYIFGKIGKDKFSVLREFSNMTLVRPKEIVGNSFDFLINKVNYEHLQKIMHQTFIFALCGFVVYFQFRNYFLRAKKFFSGFKKRENVICKECGLNMCNVMCEKCQHMSEYCSTCYINLQGKIDRSEIIFDDVKCGSCKKVLDDCQKFSYD